MNESAYADSGLSAAMATKTAANEAIVGCGLSTASAALENQNIATERSTDGEAPTTYR